MAGQTEQKRKERRPGRIARAVMSLLPLLAALGVLAPGIVQVLAQAEPEEEEEVVFHFEEGRLLGRQPLLPVPRDFSAGFVPELIDIEDLFDRHDSSPADTQRLFARLLSFPRSHGDTIVLDDTDNKLSKIVFADPVMVGQLVAQDFPPPNPLAFPWGDPVPMSDGLRYDDPFGPFPDADGTNVVPEPSTALLLGLALTGLAYRRRS